MSFLSVCQDASLRIGIDRPTAVLGSSTREHLELAQIVREAAERIMDAHDWQTLTRLSTHTGDGSATAFDLPSDFANMSADARVWSSRLRQPFAAFSRDEWLDYENRNVQFVYGAWVKIGDQINIKPVMASGETAKYYYQSNLVWNDGSSNIATPVSDDDTFRLSDRLLMLASVWQWKQLKGLAFDQDYMDYERALGHEIDKDRGPRAILFGEDSLPRDVRVSYPWVVEPYS